MSQITSALHVIQHSLTEWWYSWLTLALLNTLLVLCWITVILGPPATFGMYYAVHSLAITHSTNWREFVEGMRRYFLKSWLWMLLNVGAILLLRISIEFYSQYAETAVLLLLSVFLGVLWFCVQFYALPFLMEQEQKNLRIALRNGLFTLLASPLYTLILLLVVLLAFWLSMSLPILLLIGIPAFIAMLGIFAVRERVETFKIRQSETTDSKP